MLIFIRKGLFELASEDLCYLNEKCYQGQIEANKCKKQQLKIQNVRQQYLNIKKIKKTVKMNRDMNI